MASTVVKGGQESGNVPTLEKIIAYAGTHIEITLYRHNVLRVSAELMFWLVELEPPSSIGLETVWVTVNGNERKSQDLSVKEYNPNWAPIDSAISLLVGDGKKKYLQDFANRLILEVRLDKAVLGPDVFVREIQEFDPHTRKYEIIYPPKWESYCNQKVPKSPKQKVEIPKRKMQVPFGHPEVPKQQAAAPTIEKRQRRTEQRKQHKEKLAEARKQCLEYGSPRRSRSPDCEVHMRDYRVRSPPQPRIQVQVQVVKKNSKSAKKRNKSKSKLKQASNSSPLPQQTAPCAAPFQNTQGRNTVAPKTIVAIPIPRDRIAAKAKRPLDDQQKGFDEHLAAHGKAKVQTNEKKSTAIQAYVREKETPGIHPTRLAHFATNDPMEEPKLKGAPCKEFATATRRFNLLNSEEIQSGALYTEGPFTGPYHRGSFQPRRRSLYPEFSAHPSSSAISPDDEEGNGSMSPPLPNLKGTTEWDMVMGRLRQEQYEQNCDAYQPKARTEKQRARPQN
jgi:hypothetical protein